MKSETIIDYTTRKPPEQTITWQNAMSLWWPVRQVVDSIFRRHVPFSGPDEKEWLNTKPEARN